MAVIMEFDCPGGGHVRVHDDDLLKGEEREFAIKELQREARAIARRVYEERAAQQESKQMNAQ